jgi:hypothetical protein
LTLLKLASRRTFASLRRHRNYRLFFFGQLTSVAGTWMQNIAMAWLVVTLEPHSRGLAVGVLAVCRFGPFTLLGLLAGVVTDRFDNRHIVIVTQSVQMFFSAVLAAITLLGQVQLWEVFTIAALTGTALVFDAPSRQNLTFQMVGRDELPNAIALNSSLFNTARIFGPALAGVLIAAFGSGWCFAINTLSFVAVLGGLLAMRVSELYPLLDRRQPTLWRGTREGFAYARLFLDLLQLQRPSAAPREDDARRRAAHSRGRLGLLRRRRARRCALGRRDVASDLAGDVRRRRRLRSLRAPDRAVPFDRDRRRTALRLRRVLHELHGQREHGDPAREPRLHPRPRARSLLLRVERACAVRSAARRLAL